MNVELDQPVASEGDVWRLADHLFRHEAGKLVSVLTRIFGMDRLELAEDVVQEALIRALKTWPYYGVPKNPAAWLTQTAKNLALDRVRREQTFQSKQEEIVAFVEQWGAGAEERVAADGEEIGDERLRLMFACCHPLVPQEAQAALALKTLCGFSPGEIAKAFLTTEAAVAKRLVRARQRIRELRVPFEIPSGPELEVRIDGVLQTIYLLFNEGYNASSGERLIREDLCNEAIRLADLLAKHPVGDQPKTHALLALMLLNAARFSSRIDPNGQLLRLNEQDRSTWDRHLITRGMKHLMMSASGEEICSYHLQAGIAACHCAATDYTSTDWRRILALYDRLVEMDGDPVVALNRTVALSEVSGPAAGIEALESIPNVKALESYHLLYAVRGEFEWAMGQYATAAEGFRKALSLTALRSEQQFLKRRLRECEERLVDTVR